MAQQGFLACGRARSAGRVPKLARRWPGARTRWAESVAEPRCGDAEVPRGRLGRLLFRELKTQYRIDDLRSRSRHVTECLLYASLLTLAVSRRLHKLLAPNPSRLPQRHPFDRWAVLFTAISRDLLDLIVGPISQRAFIAVRLRRFLLHEARDPNRRRLLLPVRAQLGQFGALT